jgi:hypothetical protein
MFPLCIANLNMSMLVIVMETQQCVLLLLLTSKCFIRFIPPRLTSQYLTPHQDSLCVRYWNTVAISQIQVLAIVLC